MPRLLPAALALATFAGIPAIAQTAAQAPSQTTAQAPAKTAAAPTTQLVKDEGITTLHSTAKLVVVDVVVTDRDHHPVHGLKQSDFTLLESKKPQQIKSFDEHSALTDAAAAKFEPMPKMPPGIFTNFEPAPVNSALNIVLLDTLNTPLKDQMFVRNQLLDYLKHAKPGTRVAIFGLTSKLVLLQGFTSDPDVLKTAINKTKSIRASLLLDDPANGATADSGDLSDFGMAQISANVSTFESIEQSFMIQQRVEYTLDAMNNLARYLSNLPGRKNLIWFSGSFPLDILPDGEVGAAGGDPFAAVLEMEDEYRETTNLLARSQVAVYPVDARGLMVAPMFDASTSGAKFARNPAAFGQANTAFFNKTTGEHATMQRMAQDTGGEAYINTNGLAQAVTKAIENGSNYYTLTYAPSDTKWNGDYRPIKVTLAQQGYNLSYRHGYYSDDPDAPPKKGHTETAATATPTPPAVHTAMMHGSPGSTQIIFKVRALPVSAENEPEVAPGNQVNPDPKKAHGPYRRYAVDYAADPRMITFEHTAEGKYHCSLQWVVYVYDPEGQLINISLRDTEANITAAQYNATMHGGVPFHQEVSVPAKGEYYLRIAVHDALDSHIGAVEIPVDAVKNLPPVTASAAPVPPKPAADTPVNAPH
ncbi:VWFA-related domain-containing protein [Granulicella rosea]|uniref:VWFA-related domain-containing protein n=1 Tax=Granulicella rosea TaxID=474952 RepID=A0A239INE8_9BACT|nr:VWA domain-containing protein [Granulicella rosea]SNS95079.1 VWFA-related domain-containing protein [Granulicella rosea]